MKAFKKNLRHTPRKLRLIVDSIRQLTPQQALDQLAFSSKFAARPLIKAIEEAIANAQHLHPSIDTSQLRFKRIEVNEGITFKRFRIAGRGRVKPYQKRTSHLDLELELIPPTPDKIKASPKKAIPQNSPQVKKSLPAKSKRKQQFKKPSQTIKNVKSKK